MMEHQNEKSVLEAHHREEEERRRAALASMQPGCPWHGTPPYLQMDAEWQVRSCESMPNNFHRILEDWLVGLWHGSFNKSVVLGSMQPGCPARNTTIPADGRRVAVCATHTESPYW
jgi:hypothetical protein